MKSLFKAFPLSRLLVLLTSLLMIGNMAGCVEEISMEGKSVVVDGSSTVEPISSAVAEMIKKDKGVKVVVKTSGTGGGFKKFARGETDINDASRPIKESEIKLCKEAGVEYATFQVAIDGLSVVVNKKNSWCKSLSVQQLKKLWEPESEITTWKDLNPDWPDKKIILFGPDTDSGTYDYFIEEIVGRKDKSCRSDYSAAVDDNTIAKGVKGSEYALGYFGYAYYSENRDSLNAVGIAKKEDLSDSVFPTDETIENGTYTPLSRPLFIYVNKKSLKKKAVADFVKYYLNKGQSAVKKVGYISTTEEIIQKNTELLKKALSSK